MNTRTIASQIIAVLLALCLLPGIALAETYVHGYLRYEVADHSITITGYAGTEKTVVIPNMIGGDPVNTIASGAFANATDVVAVYLPSSVVTVEQGAFAVGQAVMFTGDATDPTAQDNPASNAPSSADSGATGEAAPAQDNASTTQPAIQTPGLLGIRTSNGSLMTVDNEGHLLYVDASGTEYVVDDTRAYTRETRPDGTVSIRNDAGEEIAVSSDGSAVNFADAQGRKIAVDTSTGVTTVNDGGSTYSVEEAEIDDKAANAASDARSQQPAASTTDVPVVPIAIGVIAALGAAGFFIWKRKQDANQDSDQKA